MDITKSGPAEALHPLDEAARLVGGRNALAQLLCVSVAAIGNWKVRGVPLEHCVPIERATVGVVGRRDLHPDDWQDIWPELAETGAFAAPAANHAGAIRTVAEEAKGAIRDFEHEAEAALEDVAENVKGGLKQLIQQAETTLARGAVPAAPPAGQAGPGPLPIVDFEDSLPPIRFPDSLPAADAPGSGDTNHQTGA